MKHHHHSRRRCRSMKRQRRDFFRKTILMGAAALLGEAGRRKTATAGAEPVPAPKADGGYRLTAHIRRYYERASL